MAKNRCTEYKVPCHFSLLTQFLVNITLGDHNCLMSGQLQFDSISEIFLSILLEYGGTHFNIKTSIFIFERSLSTHKAPSVNDGIFNRPAAVRYQVRAIRSNLCAQSLIYFQTRRAIWRCWFNHAIRIIYCTLVPLYICLMSVLSGSARCLVGWIRIFYISVEGVILLWLMFCTNGSEYFS